MYSRRNTGSWTAWISLTLLNDPVNSTYRNKASLSILGRGAFLSYGLSYGLSIILSEKTMQNFRKRPVDNPADK